MTDCLNCAVDDCFDCALNTLSLIGEESCCCGRITDPNRDDNEVWSDEDWDDES